MADTARGQFTGHVGENQEYLLPASLPGTSRCSLMKLRTFLPVSVGGLCYPQLLCT